MFKQAQLLYRFYSRMASQRCWKQSTNKHVEYLLIWSHIYMVALCDAITVDAIFRPNVFSTVVWTTEGARLCCVLCNWINKSRRKATPTIDIEFRVAKCNFWCRHFFFSFSHTFVGPTHRYAANSLLDAVWVCARVRVSVLVFGSSFPLVFEEIHYVLDGVHERMQLNALLFENEIMTRSSRQ